jgi:mono/diheme cytochrome c family protein
MGKGTWLFPVLALVIMVGWWYSSPVLAAGDPEKGRPIYEKYCLLCHGPQGMGDGPQGKLMNPPAADFKSPESKKKSDMVLLKTIQEGHSKTAMTGWENELNKRQMMDVLSYIRKLSGKDDKGL